VSTLEVRRGDERFLTRTDWLESRSSFSYGAHYDPDNVAFGPLLALNDDVLAAGAGFDTHPHSGVDILTWVLDGELTHRDSAGNTGIARPGRTQRLRTGRGVEHSERNEGTRPVHYVQMWIVSDQPDAEPDYTQRDLEAELAAGGLVTVAAGGERQPGPAVLELHNSGAAFMAARMPAGDAVELPATPLLHVFVGRGAVEVDGVGRLDAGDALRARAAQGFRVQATAPAEILVWELPLPMW
jgi:redox-sensitive bicupin YhaK (pirin superfamily)